MRLLAILFIALSLNWEAAAQSYGGGGGGMAAPMAPLKTTQQPLRQTQGQAGQQKPATATTTALPPVQKPLTPVLQQANYFYPGALVFRDGAWIGTDNLFNLTNNIGVYVSILKPTNINIGISEGEIQAQIEQMFIQAGINPHILAPPNHPPLPFFHLEFLIYNVADKGFVACCKGRLFESVFLHRFIFDPNMAMQAITWEKDSLFIVPVHLLIQEMKGCAEDVTKTFIERFKDALQYKKSLPPKKHH